MFYIRSNVQVTEWLLEQRRLFGVPLTYKAAERERRRENKHSNACRRLDFASPLHKTVKCTPLVFTACTIILFAVIIAPEKNNSNFVWRSI